jgi:hypothetical protein
MNMDHACYQSVLLYFINSLIIEYFILFHCRPPNKRPKVAECSHPFPHTSFDMLHHFGPLFLRYYYISLESYSTLASSIAVNR